MNKTDSLITKLHESLIEKQQEVNELSNKYRIMKENAKTLAARIDKAVENAKLKIKGYNETINMLIYSSVESKRYEITELKFRISEQEDLINILEGREQ